MLHNDISPLRTAIGEHVQKGGKIEVFTNDHPLRDIIMYKKGGGDSKKGNSKDHSKH